MLKPDGGMSIGLYGVLGRTGVYAAQQVVRMLRLEQVTPGSATMAAVAEAARAVAAKSSSAAAVPVCLIVAVARCPHGVVGKGLSSTRRGQAL